MYMTTYQSLSIHLSIKSPYIITIHEDLLRSTFLRRCVLYLGTAGGGCDCGLDARGACVA